jgi:multidrug transporter EmrE-like cation transporter
VLLIASNVSTWATIAIIVVASTAGDVLTARAMKVLDLDEIRAQAGLMGAVKAVVTSGDFLGGIFFMAVGFFSLLTALSWAEVSLVAPAAASLTFVTNAVAARFFLKENVDRRRWIAAVLVCGGVALLTQ